MPLISKPEHGTYFGLNGQRGPKPKELKAVQDKCAVGVLGEDRSQEFTIEKFLEMPVDYSAE